MALRSISICLVTAGLLTAVGLADQASAADLGPGPIPSPVAALIGGSFTECAGCYECTGLDKPVAYDLDTQPYAEWLVLDSYCTTYPHPHAENFPCSMLNECQEPIGGEDLALAVTKLEQAAAVEDANAILTLIRESDRFYLAPERSAVQVLNCTRTGVQAQVALGTGLLSTLLNDNQN